MANTPSPPAKAVSNLISPYRDWGVAGAAIVLGLVAFGVLFRSEIATAISVWNDNDAYNHCLLVVPVAAYLAWDRRQIVAATMPRAAPWIALLAIPAAAAWFAADRLGIMEGRQLTAMALLQIMVAAVIGLRTWRTLAAPLLYLFFLVPFGEFLVVPLQTLVVHFTTIGLGLLGIPTYANGISIEIPEGTFLVHQACSGLRFLVASAAFGVLYACVMYTSPLRRLVFSLLALAVAIIGNCFRVLGTIALAHFIGNVQAVEADHILWGWLFYVILGAVLILLGFAFRQERHPPVGGMPTGSGGTAAASIAALAAVILLAAAPRAAADYLNRVGASTAAAARITMPELPGCSAVSPPTAAPAAPPAGDGAAPSVSRSGTYRCDGNVFQLSLYDYPPRIGVRPLFLAFQAAKTPPAGGDILLETGDFRPIGGPDAPVWRVTEVKFDDRFVAVARALWVNGRPSGAGIAARIDQALNSVRPAPLSPVLAVVTHFASGGPSNARQAVDGFLARAAGLSEFVLK
jgi:exosortase A